MELHTVKCFGSRMIEVWYVLQKYCIIWTWNLLLFDKKVSRLLKLKRDSMKKRYPYFDKKWTLFSKTLLLISRSIGRFIDKCIIPPETAEAICRLSWRFRVFIETDKKLWQVICFDDIFSKSKVNLSSSGLIWPHRQGERN